jgi:flagellar basal-body rod protein FlgF
MDRLIYTALSGARTAMERQAVVANNLANVSTQGFRAEVAAFRAVPVPTADGATASRVLAMESTLGADFSPGVIHQTGRDLDVAVQGSGWIAVRASDGSEAYTRAGSLQLSPSGLLMTPRGESVLSTAGPISVPPGKALAIGQDGTISQYDPANPGRAQTVGRIKLVDPKASELVRGADGLFRLRAGGEAPTAEGVRLVGGALEGSNVNPAEAMVAMIDEARRFEMQMKMLQSAEGNARASAQLLTLG